METRPCTQCMTTKPVEGGKITRTTDGRTRFRCQSCMRALRKPTREHHARSTHKVC